MINKKIKKYPIGIRTSSPNELWHIDVTEIRINKRKYFLQIIIDNYSRYIINWRLMEQWDGDSTKKLINDSIKKYEKPLRIVSDASKENLNNQVLDYLN